MLVCGGPHQQTTNILSIILNALSIVFTVQFCVNC
nr:MAG TPA: hypothetical protein [Caudoviricetes sp.]